jgi:hypothetical protein
MPQLRPGEDSEAQEHKWLSNLLAVVSSPASRRVEFLGTDAFTVGHESIESNHSHCPYYFFSFWTDWTGTSEA